jgi:hypothetical protein
MGWFFGIAGWSSPVARQAHNLKVAGSNPAPATIPNRLGGKDLWLRGRAADTKTDTNFGALLAVLSQISGRIDFFAGGRAPIAEDFG